MILYTPLSETDIFPTENTSDQREYLSYRGKNVIAERTTEGNYQLVPLLSTAPLDFLDETYTPGSILSHEHIGKKR